MFDGPVTIQKLLEGMKRFEASDLHVKVGIQPVYRVQAQLRRIDCQPLNEDDADHLLDPIVPENLRKRFEEQGDIDFATYTDDGDRFRVNMFRSGGHVNAAIRRVKAEIPTYQQLHLPSIYDQLVSQTHEGLILVVGVTGCGKSTTLAAMIEHINATRGVNIITVEDPVEYRFASRTAIISQREIGIDVLNYKQALRYVVRQDPDVIFIGEMRDYETVLAAIQAAETGHLVFGTMHTAEVMQSFSRMLEFFPQEQHGFVRHALANTLKAICAQRLLPAVDGFEVGVVPATEVLLSNPAMRERIREGMDQDLPAIIESCAEEGMRSFTRSLAQLVNDDWVEMKVALDHAPNRSALDSMLKGVEVKAQTLVSRIKS